MIVAVFTPSLCYSQFKYSFPEHYQIRRTCTDDFEVNFFMVNHACMTEGHRHGHMCFCEEDECNGAESISLSFAVMTTSMALAAYFAH